MTKVVNDIEIAGEEGSSLQMTPEHIALTALLFEHVIGDEQRRKRFLNHIHVNNGIPSEITEVIGPDPLPVLLQAGQMFGIMAATAVLATLQKTSPKGMQTH